MAGKTWWPLFLAALCCYNAGSAAVLAQQTADDLAALRQEFNAASGLDEAIRASIGELLDAAQQSRDLALRFEQQLQAIQELPPVQERKEELELQLQQIREAKPLQVSAEQPPAELEAQVNSTRDEVNRLTKLVSDSETDISQRRARREEMRARLVAMEGLRADAQARLAALPESDTSLATRASRLRWQNELVRLDRETAHIQAALARYDQEDNSDLIRLQSTLYKQQLVWQQAALTSLEQSLAAIRQRNAEASTREAKQEQEAVASSNPVLAHSYQVNTTLAERNQAIVTRAAEVKARQDGVRERLVGLQRQFRETRMMVQRIGLSGSVGSLLRKRKSELPNAQANLIRAREIKAEVDEIQFELFDYDRQIAELSPESMTAEILAANDGLDAAAIDSLAPAIDTLIASRRELLTAARKNLGALFESLVDIEFRYRTLSEVAGEFRNYINERILWIRSNKLLLSEVHIDDSDLRVFSAREWQNVWQKSRQLVAGNLVLFSFLGLLIAGLIIIRRRLRREIKQMGEQARRGSCDTFWPTARTAFATLLLALPGPAVLLVLGLAIRQSNLNDGKSLFSALGLALLAAAWFALPIEFFRQVCRSGGLAESHLTWSNNSVAVLKRDLGWMGFAGTAIVFSVVLLLRLDPTHNVDLLERFLFVIGMALLFVFLFRALHPRSGIFRDYLQSHERSWAKQTSAVWFVTVLLIPAALSLLAIFGYYYTGLNLFSCALTTIVFAISVEVIRALLMRFILVRRRHVHIESARRKLNAERELRLQAARESRASGNEEGDQLHADAGETAAVEGLAEIEPEFDIDENATQARNLVTLVMWLVWGIGLWLIWTDVLPALKALDSRPIFSNQVADAAPPMTGAPAAPPAQTDPVANGVVGPVPGGNVASDSGGVESTTSQLTQVTYGDILLFLVIAAITLAAARNLPSVLEMVFLNQLPVDRSVRYAIKALISYGIVLVGTILAFRALSISWSNVQWLATALTFGLAFGLQEIFANFVAGIILMFERPMRIGDWITIDDFTGMVTRIRTRATTIVNLERKEFVIPNKDFITGRLVNWTLSDAINRIDVTVGVAYGSEVEKAKEILLEIAAENPKIVEEPPPSVIFQEFGNSSLNLVLRCFLKDIDSRMPTIDDLHTKINRAFEKAHITISFPQRDLHLRSIDEGLAKSLASAGNGATVHRASQS